MIETPTTRTDLRAVAARGAAELGPDASAEQVLAWARETFGHRMIVASNMQDAVLVDLAAKAVDAPGSRRACSSRPATTSPRPSARATRSARSTTSRSSTPCPSTPSPSRTRCWARTCSPATRTGAASCARSCRCERTLAGYDAWVTGVRRVEAPTRANTPLVTWDEKHGLVKINPIAAWSDEQMQAYIDEHHVLVNPLVDEGYPSIGCRTCTIKPLPGADPRSGRWAGRAKTECGLHGMTTAVHMSAPVLDALDALESESIHIFREVAGEFDRPVILFSGGKDSTLLVHLAVKAFAPAPVPFPLLHVDTGHNYPEVIDFRDRLVERLACGWRSRTSRTGSTTAGSSSARTAPATRCRPSRCSTRSTSTGSTPSSAAAGATRSARGPRSGSSACATRSAAGTRARSARSCGTSTTAGTRPVSTSGCSRSPTGPSWTSGATSSARTSSFRRSTTPTSARCSAATACGWPRARGAGRAGNEALETKTVRYRTVGDGSCTGAVESAATTLDEIIAEVTASRLTERGATRADDRLSEAAMEDRKREGYF